MWCWSRYDRCYEFSSKASCLTIPQTPVGTPSNGCETPVRKFGGKAGHYVVVGGKELHLINNTVATFVVVRPATWPAEEYVMTEFRFPPIRVPKAGTSNVDFAAPCSSEQSGVHWGRDAQTQPAGFGFTSPADPTFFTFGTQKTSAVPYDGIIDHTTYNGAKIAYDQRIPITSTSAPYKSLAKISTLSSAAGTGVIVGPRHILTSAHTVWDLYTKKKATGIQVKPHGAANWLSVSSANVWVYNQYTNQPDSDLFNAMVEQCKWDFAVLRTSQTIATGGTTNGGWFHYSHYTNPATVLTMTLRACGFPDVNKPCRNSAVNTQIFSPKPFGVCNGKLYETTVGKVVNVSVPGVFQHSFDMAGGMSGCPIFQHDAVTKKSTALALHSFWDESYGNFASAITSTIKSWVAAVIATYP